MATDRTSPSASGSGIPPAGPGASAVLAPDACRDETTLRRFVEENISPNAWPIHAGQVRKRILCDGLDTGRARRFAMPVDAMQDMMVRFYARSRRVERALGIDNAFHRTLHNYEVLLRLLVLEWPAGEPLPEDVRQAPRRIYSGLDSIMAVIVPIVRGLIERGVASADIARDVLAALGHDYGHTGGTDRLDRDGLPMPATHEEVAEKHAAKLGIEYGFPPALILESMAGIRATTFYSRPGRDKVRAANDFERKLTLADVMGCVLPAAQWLVHVGAPVLVEKTPVWRRRLAEIPVQVAQLDRQIAALSPDDPLRRRKEDEWQALATEDARIVKHIEEWFHSERGFFLFIEAQRLAAVEGAAALWGDHLREKIALMERVLARKDLLGPLVAEGFAFLDQTARMLSGSTSLRDVLGRQELDPRLREILSVFLEPCGQSGSPAASVTTAQNET